MVNNITSQSTSVKTTRTPEEKKIRLRLYERGVYMYIFFEIIKYM